MKTFDKLTLGDEFWMVYANHEGIIAPNFKRITVSNISVEEDEIGNVYIIINKSKRAFNEYWDLKCLIDCCNTNIVDNGDEIYFTTDETKVNELLGQTAIRYIRAQEKKIKERKEEIERIRMAYWDYLNPSLKK